MTSATGQQFEDIGHPEAEAANARKAAALAILHCESLQSVGLLVYQALPHGESHQFAGGVEI